MRVEESLKVWQSSSVQLSIASQELGKLGMHTAKDTHTCAELRVRFWIRALTRGSPAACVTAIIEGSAQLFLLQQNFMHRPQTGTKGLTCFIPCDFASQTSHLWPSATPGWQEPVYQLWGAHLKLLSPPTPGRDTGTCSPQVPSITPDTVWIPPPDTWMSPWAWCSLGHASACLRPDLGLISDWPCQALVCTPLPTSRAPRLTTGTPCSCTRTRFQLQIILTVGTKTHNGLRQEGLFTFPATCCANYSCFLHRFNFPSKSCTSIPVNTGVQRTLTTTLTSTQVEASSGSKEVMWLRYYKQ